MKAFFFTSLFMLILVSSVFPQSKEVAVVELLKKYCIAVERGDTVALKEVFSEDMIVTSTSGNLRGKQEEIADLVVPGLTMHFFKTEGVRIRSYNSSAVATGRLVWKMNYQGKDAEIQRRFTFVLSRTDGSLKIVAQHIGRTPQ